MPKPADLQKAAWAARCAHRELLDEIKQERKKRMDAAATLIDSDLAKHNAKIKELADAAWAAEQAELAEREQLAAASLPYPVGTKLCGWKNHKSWHHHPDRWQLDVYGIVEICTRETVHPAGMANYSRSSIGTVLVRLLKKDGTPSKNYEPLDRIGRSNCHHWMPEGRKPKGAA